MIRSFSLKSNGAFNSKLKPLYSAFLHGKKLSIYRTGTRFDKEPLAVEPKNAGAKSYTFTLSMI